MSENAVESMSFDLSSPSFSLRSISRIAIPVLIILLLLRVLSPSLKADVSFSQAIYDRNGKLLRLTLSRDEKYRLWLPLKAISPVLVKATLLHEDKWFRFHPGVSPTSLFRAVWHTYVKKDRKIGGSTITMQLARIRYDINSRTISGKTKQILAAFWLELLYSKSEILEAYLNLVPYGLNIEGAGAGSPRVPPAAWGPGVRMASQRTRTSNRPVKSSLPNGSRRTRMTWTGSLL
jgi:penicillin-binding protein 1C